VNFLKHHKQSDAVDESTVLADTETTEAQPVPIETQDVEIQEAGEISSSEEIEIETPAEDVDISPTIEDTTEEIATVEPQIETPDIVPTETEFKPVASDDPTETIVKKAEETVVATYTLSPDNFVCFSICRKIIRDVFRFSNSCPDYTISPNGLLNSVPIHWVFSKGIT
jgi:hypothetical protein